MWRAEPRSFAEMSAPSASEQLPFSHRSRHSRLMTPGLRVNQLLVPSAHSAARVGRVRMNTYSLLDPRLQLKLRWPTLLRSTRNVDLCSSLRSGAEISFCITRAVKTWSHELETGFLRLNIKKEPYDWIQRLSFPVVLPPT